MSSDLSNGVSRRNFMRILGAASAAATSFPALAAVSPQTARRGMGGDDMGSMLYCLRFMKGSSPLWSVENGTR